MPLQRRVLLLGALLSCAAQELLLLFYSGCRKAVPGHFSGEHPAQEWCGGGKWVPLIPTSHALLPRSCPWVLEGECEIWQGGGLCVREVPFAISAQITHACSPVLPNPWNIQQPAALPGLLTRMAWGSGPAPAGGEEG